MTSRRIKRKQITALSLGKKAVNLRNSFAAKWGSAIHNAFNDNLQSHDNVWIRKTNQSGLCSGVGQATQASGCRRRVISLYSSKDNELTARSVSLPRTVCVCFLYNAFKYPQSTHVTDTINCTFYRGCCYYDGIYKNWPLLYLQPWRDIGTRTKRLTKPRTWPNIESRTSQYKAGC